jgi:biopolymer transport protein ExbD
LKSVSVSSVDIKPSANVKLPSSASKELPQRFVAFDIQRQGIYLEKKLIQPLQDFVLPEQEPNQDTMFNLRNAVMDHIKQGKIQSTVMVIRADREAPFDIIWRVMYTARQLGFEEFQNLAVQEVKNKTI